MKDIADTPPTKRSRQRRAKRRPRMRWGRLFVCLVIFAVIAVAGLASGTIVAISHNLPNIDAMKPVQLGQDTVIYDSNGHRIAELYGAVNRLIVPSAQIPEVMKNATVAVEDKRFYQHHGVDFTGIARAFVDDVRAGRVVSGASTLTEQYVKNAYLGDDVTISRKLREAVLAWELEDRWSKDKILTEYLNTVYYGAGAYGVQAASLTYFHKPISKVSLAQAALLAALPKFPSEYSPITDPGVIKARRDLVLSDMAEQGYITTAQAAAAESKPIKVFSKPLSTTQRPGRLLRRLRHPAARQPVRRTRDLRGRPEGLHDDRHEHAARRDRRPQGQAAVGRLRRGARGGRPGQRLHPRHGGEHRLQDLQVQPHLAGHAPARLDHEALRPARRRRGGREPGVDLLQLPPAAHLPGTRRRPALLGCLHRREIVGRTHEPRAGDTGVRQHRLRPALPRPRSRQGRAVAKAMGITTKLIAEPSVVLGSEDVNVLEMANAYATFADEGVRHTPQAIAKVVFPNGKVSKAHVRGVRVRAGRRLLRRRQDPRAEHELRGRDGGLDAQLLQGPLGRQDRHHDNYWDAWFCGFNPRLATAVWMGYPQGAISMPGVFGATYSLPIWGTFYNSVFGSTYIPDFATPAHHAALEAVGGQVLEDGALALAVAVAVALEIGQEQAQATADRDHHGQTADHAAAHHAPGFAQARDVSGRLRRLRPAWAACR